ISIVHTLYVSQLQSISKPKPTKIEILVPLTSLSIRLVRLTFAIALLVFLDGALVSTIEPH
ncbi:MAG: hypothetical protein ACRD2L_04280, partial [Terriglobia bacterium]